MVQTRTSAQAMSFAIQAATIRLAARFSAALACEVNGCAPVAMRSLPVGSQHSRSTMPVEVRFKSRVKSEDVLWKRRRSGHAPGLSVTNMSMSQRWCSPSWIVWRPIHSIVRTFLDGQL
jgi:hypothetical protein